MIANIGYGDSWYAMWGAGSSGYWDSNGNELPDLKGCYERQNLLDGRLTG